MRRLHGLLFVLSIILSVGCSHDDGKWRFNPIELFFREKDPREALPPGHPDRVESIEKLRDQGYGYKTWDDLKKKLD